MQENLVYACKKYMHACLGYQLIYACMFGISIYICMHACLVYQLIYACMFGISINICVFGISNFRGHTTIAVE